MSQNKDTQNILYPIDSTWRFDSTGAKSYYFGSQELISLNGKKTTQQTYKQISPVGEYSVDDGNYLAAADNDKLVGYMVSKDNSDCAFMLPTGELRTDFSYSFYALAANKDETLICVSTTNTDSADNSNEKYGVININGKVIIPLKYYSPINFQDGIAAVSTTRSDNSYIYIDETGKVLFNKIFTSANNFINGLALVMDTNNKWGYIDKKGDYAILPTFDEASDFDKYNYACVVTGNKGMIIDKKGNVIQKDKYQNGLSFDDYKFQSLYGDYYFVRTIKDYSQSSTYYDKDFNRIEAGPDVHQIDYISPDYVRYDYDNGDTAIVKGNKKTILKDEFAVEWVGGNKFIVETRDNTAQLIDDSGNVIFSLNDCEFSRLSNQLLLVTNKGTERCGIYNWEGKEILPIKYKNIEWIDGKVFRVTLGYETGFINLKGQWLYKKSMLQYMQD